MLVNQTETTQDLLVARQIIASSLAGALADPRSPLARRCDGGDLEILRLAWHQFALAGGAMEQAELGLGERRPSDVSIDPVIEWLLLPVARREIAHQRVFGLVTTKLCPSYETEYCAWTDATHRAQELADIAGFYHAFGVGPNRAAPERVDHVSLEIEFIALMIEKERIARSSGELTDSKSVEICRDARVEFLRDHAAWWMPTFGRLLEKRSELLCGDASAMTGDLRNIAGVAQVLCAWMAAERTFADVAPSRRIVDPTVAPQEANDSCGSCGSCGNGSCSDGASDKD